ncbi:hypothetical protein Sjap_002718 [Stephania japonica]|uniref:Uncharacterized protein n=1 Tax=Stephania japonica TaxID=461633 RepID=A0AAP0KNY1_9MAGN
MGRRHRWIARSEVVEDPIELWLGSHSPPEWSTTSEVSTNFWVFHVMFMSWGLCSSSSKFVAVSDATAVPP